MVTGVPLSGETNTVSNKALPDRKGNEQTPQRVLKLNQMSGACANCSAGADGFDNPAKDNVPTYFLL